MMRKTRGVGVPRPLGKAAVPMRKLAGFLLAAVLLTLPVRAAEPAAPESSPAASLAAVITSAAALALVGWLRSRRH